MICQFARQQNKNQRPLPKDRLRSERIEENNEQCHSCFSALDQWARPDSRVDSKQKDGIDTGLFSSCHNPFSFQKVPCITANKSLQRGAIGLPHKIRTTLGAVP